MRRSAFSLVELLAAVAIILVLAGLVFAVFGSSKRRSKQTVCLTQLAQLGKGLSLYCDDHDGLVPPYSTEVFKPQPPAFTLLDESGKFKSAVNPYIGSDDLFYCPADPHKKKSANITTTATSLHTSYTYGGAVYILHDKSQRFLNTRLVDSPLPADSSLLEDRGIPKVSSGMIMYEPSHDSLICTVFFDLHAECESGVRSAERNTKLIKALGA